MGNPEGFMCMDCGKVLSGPHAEEEAGAEGVRTHKYKGHNYSGGLCEDCERKRHIATLKKARHRGRNFLRANRVMGVE